MTPQHHGTTAPRHHGTTAPRHHIMLAAVGLLSSGCLYTDKVWRGHPGTIVDCNSETCDWRIEVTAEQLIGCFGDDAYPAPFDDCGENADCTLATSPGFVDAGAACLDPDSNICDECQALTLLEWLGDAPGEQARDQLLADMVAACPALDELEAFAVCVPDGQVCEDQHDGCDEIEAFARVDAQLEADSAQSRVRVTTGGVSTGWRSVWGSMYTGVEGGDASILAGSLWVTNTTYLGSTYVDNFLVVSEDVDVDPSGNGYFTIPADSQGPTTFYTTRNGLGKAWGVGTLAGGQGRVLANGTWWFNYSSTGGTPVRTVEVHLEGNWY